MMTIEAPAARAGYDPADRYRAGGRPVILTGVQAIARLLVEQHARDARAGLRTASFVSGYPGSPLGGVDRLIQSLPELAGECDVVHRPGLNEELGATAVWGSQRIPGRMTRDGVVGLWYGKGPGVDRAGDALRHANTFGAHPMGGVLVMAGDDPGAKSSTVPAASERTLASFGIPVLSPRNATELIAFGLSGVAMSRFTGCWVAVKVVADVADGLWTVDTDFGALDLTLPAVEWEGRPWTYRQMELRDPRDSVVAEAALLGPRWAAVEAFGAANPFDEITVPAPGARLGIVSTGAAYDATTQALQNLGVADGIRVLRVGMPYPLGGGLVKTFAQGLDRILVIEEKAAFVESQLKEILYGAGAPLVIGKKDAGGQALVPPAGQLTADRVEPVLRAVLGLPAPENKRTKTLIPLARTPHFCSGCPHNRSTVIPDGSIAGGGIGCHIMVVLSGRPESDIVGLTQMGGEGAQWIGQAPFTEIGHLFQNMGDGTFAHSGQLALQACVAAGVNVTFKILYNSVVAMTGAQQAEGGLDVAAMVQSLNAHGVSRVVVVSDNPRKHKRLTGAAVRHRDDLDAVQRELREVPGVTVVIYDQQCANEARRLRKRGQQASATKTVVIDEAVCEGCGDCGAKSNCLSVEPVETPLGRKTRIDQTSCNADYSCLNGDCPSFLTMRPTKAAKRKAPRPPAVADPVIPSAGDLFLTGIGGTGIITVNQVLATAALRSGRAVVGLDQVGLSQKAGPVTSHLRVGDRGPANRVSGGASTLLAFDLLVAADPKNLAHCDAHTAAVVSTSTPPTGAQVADVNAPRTDIAELRTVVGATVGSVWSMDTLASATALFGSTTAANLLLVGAAYQAGHVPVPAVAIEEAIELNGVAAAENVAAFRWGRVAVADPETFARVTTPAASPAGRLWEMGGSPLAGEVREAVALRAALLADHSGDNAATAYIAVVEEAWAAERRVGARTAYSLAVARGVAHLAAYKDEYEVARLLSRNVGVTYNLHPPVLRSMGMDRKIALGPWFRPFLKALAKGKVLRGTALDPFGRSEIRTLERRLAAGHLALVNRLTAGLTGDTYDEAVRLAGAAELVRGYEGIKVANAAKYDAAVSLPLSRESGGGPLAATSR